MFNQFVFGAKPGDLSEIAGHTALNFHPKLMPKKRISFSRHFYLLIVYSSAFGPAQAGRPSRVRRPDSGS
jgi:hypothetical protein